MTSISYTVAERNPRQAIPICLIAGIFTPIKNSLHSGITVLYGSGYGVEERNKGLINLNTYPELNDRRKPAIVYLIEALAASIKSGFIRSTMERPTMSNAKQFTADFHGHALNIIDHNDQPYVSAKQIIEAIGLNWGTQYKKLHNNTERWGIVKMTIPSVSGTQSTICLPLRKLSGWLMTIQPNKVSAELRPRIIQFQNECDDVLAAHWENLHATVPANTPQLTQQGAMALSPFNTSELDQDTLQAITDMIAQHRQTGEAITITVALNQGEPVHIKALKGEVTAFQNTDLKAFIAHYQKHMEIGFDKVDALNTFLRAGSFISEAAGKRAQP